MDISKILDFHRKVLISAGQDRYKDETSCGSLCQHPACWESNRRRERGVSQMIEKKVNDEEDVIELPTQKYYNMIDDYGNSGKDPCPAYKGGRARNDPVSRRSNLSQSENFNLITAPFINPVRFDKPAGRVGVKSRVHALEVQEIFDKDDLNSCWDETFLTKRIFVWVSNHKKHNQDRQPPTDFTKKREFGKQRGRTLPSQDLTETMVPLQIKEQRDESILFDEWPVLKKKVNQSSSPLFRQGIYPKPPFGSAKPQIDCESIRELLALPKDLLLQVLDRTNDSEFLSKDKICGIIQDVLKTACSTGHNLSTHDSSTGRLYTSDILLQRKLSLHYKQPNRRGLYLMDQKPVFQLDKEDKSNSVNTSRDADYASSTQSPGFLQYKNLLPAISQNTANEEGRKEHVRKMPSVSLGLPELPSGLRQTRAFVYNSKHKPDFTLVPVPSPPASVESSESLLSNHGTTLHVNLPSVTDFRDADFYQQTPISAEYSHSAAVVCREMHAFETSSPERQVLVGTGHAPIAAAASPDKMCLDTVQEKIGEQANNNNSNTTSYSVHQNVQFSEPPPQRPTSPLSPEDWPQVTESTVEVPTSVMNVNIPDNSRSDFSNCESEHSNQITGRFLDEGGKGQSPAPPPPSPEPGDKSGTRGRRKHNINSRDSNDMEPLQELKGQEINLPYLALRGETVEPVTHEETTPTLQANLHDHVLQVFDPVSKIILNTSSPAMLHNGMSKTAPVANEEYNKSGTTPVVSEEYNKSGTTPVVSEEYNKSGTTPVVSEEYNKSGITTPVVSEEYNKSGTTPVASEEYNKSGTTPVASEEYN